MSAAAALVVGFTVFFIVIAFVAREIDRAFTERRGPRL